MSVPKPQAHTVDEYLELERQAAERHEYLDGLIYAKAGESPEHGIVCTKLSFEVLYSWVVEMPAC